MLFQHRQQLADGLLSIVMNSGPAQKFGIRDLAGLSSSLHT
jgi:hypothetical protein